MKFDTEEASGGSMVGTFLVCIPIVGFVAVVVGKAFDQLLNITNILVAIGGLSPDAANTIYYLSVVFSAITFLYLLALIINFLSTSADSSSGGV